MLYKDDAVQTDNVSAEGENEETYQDQFARNNVWQLDYQQADRLSKFLFNNDFKWGKSKTLSLNTLGKEWLIVQLYINEFIFGAMFWILCEKFVALMGSWF